MSKPSIEIQKILESEELALTLLAGKDGLSNEVSNSQINRPGLSLTGFFEYFANDRIQIFGRGEWSYLSSKSQEERVKLIEKFFSFPLICIIFTHGNHPPQIIIDYCEKFKVPLFITSIGTHIFITLLSHVLEKSIAPRTIRHGVFIEVFGIGILLLGKSGVGKSETALELIERGHKLIADDMVEIRRLSESYLIGTSSDLLKNHMEIRGIGIINIKELFGISAVLDQKLIELIIRLEVWDEEVEYDRTGLDESYEEILGVKVPSLVVPVKPGRNIPILLETAAMNQKLKINGVNTALEFNKKVTRFIQKSKIERNKIKD